MRFLNRQLLRSIIAAGLAVVGASSGLAAPGKMSVQWKEFCLINDNVDFPFPTSRWKSENPSSDLLGLRSQLTLKEEADPKKEIYTTEFCEATRDCFIASNPIVKFIVQEDISSRFQSGWRQSLQTSNAWLAHWVQLRTEVSQRLPQQAAKLIQSMNFIAENAESNAEAESPTYFTGNLFVYVIDVDGEQFQTDRDSVEQVASVTQARDRELAQVVQQVNSILSSIIQHQDVEADIESQIAAEVALEFEEYHKHTKLADAPNLQAEDCPTDASSMGACPEEACPEEAYFASAKRPPELQGDLAWQAEPQRTVSYAVDDPHGIGHCQIPEPGEVHELQALADVVPPAPFSEREEAEEFSEPTPHAQLEQHLQMPGLFGRSAIESWLDPNWDVQTWAYSTVDVLNADAPAYQAGDWTGPILDRWVSSVYAIQASIDWDAISAVPEASALVSVTSGAAQLESAASSPSNPEVSLEEASRIATKVFALKLKQLGELLIDSADRLNQVSDAIDVASRSTTQR